METHPPPYHACIFYLTPSESWNNLDYIPLPFFKKSGWMPVWLMPFELYRLTIVTFRQCTKFCFFSKHKLSNSTWWLLVPPDVIFQISHTVNSLSVLFYVFWDELGPFSKFHHSCIVIAAVFCFGFLFFLNAELIYFALRCYKSTGNLEWIWSKAVDECERN